MSESCNIRFCDNQKIINYTVSNENVSFPFTNALNTVRSKIFKTTSNDDWRLTIDLLFPDRINALAIFGPLGQALGITRFATVKIQADNVLDPAWTSPELDITITRDSDQQQIWFSEEDQYYRFWSLYIDDPLNPDIINFGYIFMGDYANPQFRAVSRGFGWQTNDPTNVVKSLNQTPYFDIRTKFDTFTGINLQFLNASDRQEIQQAYGRAGIYSPMPISIDPGLCATENINELTRFARFSTPLSTPHQNADLFSINFSLEEVI